MSLITFPTLVIKPSAYAFGQKSNTMLHTSPLSGSSQTIEMPGARWTVAMNYVNAIDPDRGRLDAFLAAMRGQANRVNLYDIVKSVPAGTMRGTMVTVGTTAAGAVAVTVQAAGQNALTLLAGDKLNIGGELKMVVADATSDGTGTIALTIEPPFRGTIAAGSGVTWNTPTALFMLTAQAWKGDVSVGAWTNYAIDLVESFN